jgi:hypothetical protein
MAFPLITPIEETGYKLSIALISRVISARPMAFLVQRKASRRDDKARIVDWESDSREVS